MSGTLDLMTRLHRADRDALGAVERALPQIARCADAIAERVAKGGRCFYLGAGTSGRLGALDAAELPPTFGVDPARFPALIAGGAAALTRAVEGAEDDEAQAVRDLDAAGLASGDALLAIAASGATPYTRGGLAHARERGALGCALVCAAASPLEAAAELAIVLDVGPEVLKGSTRLKAGTSQKLALNLLSTAIMDRLGLIWRDEMVAMKPGNAKLRARAERIVRELGGLDAPRAKALLESSAWDLPLALIRARFGLDLGAARQRLERHGGSVAAALESPA